MGLRNYFQWFIESNVLRTRRWHIQQVVKRFVTPSRDLSSFWPNFRNFFFLNNRKTIILEVCPHPKLVTHQFICFGSAELTIHMFCKDKIAELIIAASKKKTTSTNGHFSTIGHFSTAAAFFCPYKTHLKKVNCCLKGAQTQCHRALGFYINWLACHFMPTHRTLICFPRVAFQPWLLLIIQCSI